MDRRRRQTLRWTCRGPASVRRWSASAEHQRRGVTSAALRSRRRNVSSGSQRAARLRHAGLGRAG